RPVQELSVKRTPLALALLVALAATSGATSAPAGHYGGTITVGTAASPTGLDPTLGQAQAVQRILPPFCLPLYSGASNHAPLELDPILAAAQPVISADKLTYTIQLRQGIQFNDGTPLNAQAVIASYQRYLTYPGSVRVRDFAGVDRATAT